MSGRKRLAGESLVQADPETARVDDPFPRGGGFSVAPIEIKRAAADATRDVFETVKAAKKSKKNGSKHSKTGKSPAPVISARIEPLALGKIKIGTMVLGQISALKQEPNEYVVSLPNNLTGYCQCDELNPQLVGSFLRFVVENLGTNQEESNASSKQKKRLALNASPDLVNSCLHPETVVAGTSVQGEVVSVEEKGVILELGTELGRGFLALPKPELAKYTEGDFIMAFLTSNDGTQRVKTLTSDASVHVDSAIAQQAFVPGTLISSAPVVNESSFGAVYSLLGIYTASADSVHFSGPSKAVRVIFSYPPTSVNGDRALGVSNLEYLVNLAETPFFESEERPRILKTGSVVNVEILKTCPNLGVFAVILGTGLPSGAPGFVHISQIGDNDADKVDLTVDTEYKVGSVHPARILSYSSFDNTFYLSLRPDVIAQQYLAIEDIKIGDVVENGRVERIMSRGDVLVRLDGPTVGICSEQQLSDAPVRNPEQRFKIGQKVRARVLNVDVGNRKVYISLKKSIVDDKEPLLTSFTNDNHFHAGTVVKFVDSGAVILFYNNIKGLLLKSEMSETTTDMQSLLRLGETVRCRILDVDPVNERLLLSLKPRSELQTLVGEIKKAVVISKTKKETLVQVQEPSSTDSDSATDLGEAVLIGHKGKLSVGDSLDVKVLNSRAVCSDERIVNTELPASVDSIQVGSLLYGLVSGSHPQAGVFVKFLNDFTGLISANLLADTKWPATNSVVEVVVDSVDFAKGRVFLSLPKSQPLIDVTITAVKQNQLNIVTSDGKQGRIDSSLLFNSIDEIEDTKKPLSQFKTGETVSGVRVIGKHDAKNHRFLPLSHKSGTSVVMEVAKHDPVVLKKGMKVVAFVNNYSPDHASLWLTISPQLRAQLSLVDLSNQLPVLEDPTTYFPIGSAVELTILSCGSKIAATALDLESESQSYCLVTAVDLLKLTVRLPQHRTEVIECVDCADEFTKLKDTFKVGDILPYNVINGHVTLRSEQPKGISVFTVGSVVNGYVRNIASSGIFVSLAPKVVARVQIKEVSDKYLKNWQTYVKPGDVVTAKVLTNNGRIELTMKQSSITGKTTQQIDDIVVGAKYRGVVRSVAAFGVFVDFEHVTGLAHKSEISDHAIDDLKLVFKPGDKVRVKVLNKTVEDGRISLGMKAAYFEDDDGQDDLSEGDDLDVEHESKLAESEEESDAEIISDDEFDGDDFIIENDSDENKNSDESDDSDENEDDDSDSDDDSDNSDMDVDEKPKKSAGISAGFDWSGEVPTLNTNDDDDDSSDSDAESSRKKKKRSKKDEIVRDETASLQNRLPQSAKDFERLLVSSPNSSMVWMNYMAFKLQLGETEDARLVAYRALKTISQSQEAERLNVWIALLNLEARFGTSTSLDKVFKESQQFMDPIVMHLKMATILSEAGKTSDALDIYKRAQKKFGGDNLDVWLLAMRHLFTEHGNNKPLAREMGERALQRLPANKHKDFTRQFALLEFELGDPERGRTLFEALLSVSPKRIDIWNVYIDQEIKLGDVKRYTALFERVLKQKISMKQAKFFFKKWISVAADQEYVANRAREYVSSRENAENDDSEDEE